MPEPTTLPDAPARLLAETTFDRNVVVVAGAGTGKTTLLVNRLINLLIREPDPLPIMSIVGLTFTNKAATEMKLRLRARLAGLARADGDAEGRGDPGAVSLPDLRTRYGLSTEAIAARAGTALEDLEKAQIGTLHSFAAHLLRLHPLESGVDPAFQEDEGLRFEEAFTVHWDLWLDRELGAQGTEHVRWRRVLAKADLTTLRELARALSSELVPLHDLTQQTQQDHVHPAVLDWVAAKRKQAAALLVAHDRPKRRKAESMLAAAEMVLGLIHGHGQAGAENLDPAERAELARDLGDAPSGWEPAEFAQAVEVITTARRLLQVDHGFFQDVLALMRPLVERVRNELIAAGWISFDGLLARARVLLRAHPRIRERLKGEYRAVLVDEFQDTDPVQYEILLHLAEQPGRIASGWQEMDLEPGKLFIVGDPKQSIYAFRRADIEAFERVVAKIRAGGGLVCELTTNFRSHASVLTVVNEVFDRLFVETQHLQPRNVRLAPRPDRPAYTSEPGVTLRVVRAQAEEEALDSQAAARAEAEALARWLKTDVIGQVLIRDAQGHQTAMQPGHAAFLFRKLTQAQEYLEALRRHGILYVTDGEKHFYRRQEVVDLINLLRCVENPHDTIALVGVLRSALGGVPDRDLYTLRQQGALDYRIRASLAGWDSALGDPVQRLYERLDELHRAGPARPLPEVLDLLFERLPVLELAAASVEGEQAVANLLKVREIAARLADRPHLTLGQFVDLMIERLGEPPDEAESALAEESLEAVRVLTIHKAKGLEFPLVVLPGLHQGTGGDRGVSMVCHDWSSGLQGLALGDRFTLGAIPAGDKQQAREQAERRRLLYVGMTRARDTLVLSAAVTRRPDRGSILAMLEDAAGGEIGLPGQTQVPFGACAVGQTVMVNGDTPGRPKPTDQGRPEPGLDWPELLRRWEQREQAWSLAQVTPSHLTPSGMAKGSAGKISVGGAPSGDAELARLAGVLAHRVLEGWDFGSGGDTLHERIDALCREFQPELRDDLHEMFALFIASKPYGELKRATILGREVPFIMPWDGEATRHPSPVTRHPPVMQGAIDLIYKLGGDLWIADYKTDRVSARDLAQRAGDYGSQVRIYARAVAQALGLARVRAQAIFLRAGQAVEVV